MGILTRLKNGWNLGMTSLSLIKDNASLLVFPFLTGATLILVFASYTVGVLALLGFNPEQLESISWQVGLAIMFLFYLITYLIIVFFNVALVYCAREILDGREARVGAGLSHSISKLNVIVPWAFLAATIGVVLRVLQERTGAIGEVIVGLLGTAWSIATFFVIPILAHENVNPLEALKRSGTMIKEKWGESIGANFGFALLTILGYLVLVAPVVFLIDNTVDPFSGIVAGVLVALVLHAFISAAEMVFLTAAYQHVNDKPIQHFETETLDNIFINK